MLMALLLALMAVACGTLTTYLYDEDASVGARLSMGAATGFAALGLVGFLLASFLKLTTLAILLTALVLAMPLGLLNNAVFRARLRLDWTRARNGLRRAVLHPGRATLTLFLYYVAASVLFWLLFDRVMIESGGEISTGITNNYGDLPFHLGVITSFVYGENFPPQDPEFAGVKFTYPFIADFVAACFVRAGASLREALLLENFVLSISLVGVLNRWARVLIRERAAALLTPVLVLFGGGLGWWMLFNEAREGGQGIFQILGNLQHDYTIMPTGGWRWGNALTSLLIPQRSILMGLPLAIIVLTQLWLANRGELPPEDKQEVKGKEGKRVKGKKASKRERAKVEANKPSLSTFSPFPHLPLSPSSLRMIAAGLISGSLVLVHAHSFGVLMLASACLALIFKENWRGWLYFFSAAFLIAVPEMLWSARGSSTSFSSFIGWHFGWDKGEENFFWFWFKNTGFFIPLIVAAIFWRRDGKPLIPRKVLYFYLPFILFFIIPNFIRLAPWIWDNNKVIFYWYIASAPLVTMLLLELWRLNWPARLASVFLFLTLTLAGALDVWRVVSGTSVLGEFDSNGQSFAELIKEKTPPRALILNAPTFNHPVLLTGRRSLLGYTGHIWSHGLDFGPRERDVKLIYAGAPGAEGLLNKYGVEYAVTGPLERKELMVNQSFFERYTRVGGIGGYSLYKITRP